MSGPFQSGSSSEDLSGPPWNVTETFVVYIKNVNGQMAVYTDAAATIPFDPAEFRPERGISTGVYVHIAMSSDTGTKFPDNLTPETKILDWKDGGPPGTVTYGKIKSDQLAFSIKDEWDHKGTKSYEFNINVMLPSGVIRKMTLGVDPVIIEAAEIPPDGLEDR